MTVRDLGPCQAELAWSATFQPDGLPASEVVVLLEGALAADCLGLKQFHGSRQKKAAGRVEVNLRKLKFRYS